MNLATKIESDIPLPPRTNDRGRPFKYPFHELDVGDSFTIPLGGDVRLTGNNGKKDRNLSSLRSAACQYARRNGGRFTVLTVREEGVIRCWRIA